MTVTNAKARYFQRTSAWALLALAPTLLIPWPTGRHLDHLQQVAVADARGALQTSHTDPFGFVSALTARLGMTPKSTPAPAPAAVIGQTEPDLTAYAPMPAERDPIAMVDPATALGVDLAALRTGIEAYRAGDIATGDAIAAKSTDPLLATTLAWVWLRTHPREAGTGRATRFVADRPDWPGNEWLRKRIEDSFYGDHPAPVKVKAWFAGRTPDTPLGRIALSRALLESGDDAGAAALIRIVWAKDDLSPFAETQLRKTFGKFLTVADHKKRADRLMYKEKESEALRVATLSGDKELLAYEKVRAAAQDGPVSEKIWATLPARFANDPAITFAKIQLARRADKIDEAGALMLAAPRDPAVLVDPDEWWTERRLVARKLLDAKEPEKAYTICAQHSAASNENKIEAEFHAGWIALRFLNDPARAKPHFATLASLSQTPISRARAAYWLGRTAEAAGEPSDDLFQEAARYPTTYYGQLAIAKLGPRIKPPPPPVEAAEGAARIEAVRAVDALYLAGAKDLAVSLATETARNVRDPAQMKALGRIVARDRDAKVSLAVGKLAMQRGNPLEELAFPTYGVPEFEPLPNSAPLPVVYAIARQESAFDPSALSSAGAMGLMQMIASTAKRTAQRAGLAFDAARMRTEPVFNARLGAAHLGDLLAEHDGSHVLTFVAYNAGGKRVKEWIAAYGDPRRPGVDMVDWVERIPFSETRNYVQRVSENLAVYRARLANMVKGRANTTTAAVSPAPAPAPEAATPAPAPATTVATTDSGIR